MGFLYTISVHLTHLTILLASLFNKKARLWISGRIGWRRKLKAANLEESPLVWFHAASLGEFEQGRPLMEEIKRKMPGYKILLTFYSPSGYEIRKNYSGADLVMYLPSDTPGNASQFVRLVKPSMAYFIKYEFWNNYLRQLKRSNIPVYLVSGIFRPNQVFFVWYGKWFRKMLSYFSYFFVQHNQSKELLNNIGINNVTVTGDTRFDRVVSFIKAPKQIAVAERFTAGYFCLVAGSTWPQDEEHLIKLVHESPADCRYIIAPHEIDAIRIKSLLSLFKGDCILFSQAGKELQEKRVLIIDNMGMLSSLYQYGQLAYIGGGFGKGIHNILEAAAYGIPVIFGPHYGKFNEAVELVKSGGAFSIAGSLELKDIALSMIQNKEQRENAGRICLDYVLTNAGATSKILNYTRNGM